MGMEGGDGCVGGGIGGREGGVGLEYLSWGHSKRGGIENLMFGMVFDFEFIRHEPNYVHACRSGRSSLSAFLMHLCRLSSTINH